MEEQKLICNPPPKVLAMYGAVIDLINEGCDINTLKVADITTRAGIGKGTAYEYFSSKEEIVSSSILFHMQKCVKELKEITESEKSFHEKIDNIMDFIDKHAHEKQGIFFLIKIMMESYEIPKKMQDEYKRIRHRCCEKERNEILDSIVADGVREGLIREENVFLRRAAVETQLSVYFMYRVAAEKKIEIDLKSDFLREYVYQNMLKLLG